MPPLSSAVDWGKGDRGSITAAFCLLVLVLLGAVSYSLYIGKQVKNRVRLSNAADASAMTMANHAAQGLNMIAANNLAIGASLHIAGSMPILASYLSIGRLLTYDIEDTIKDMTAGLTEQVNQMQDDIWNPMAHFSAVYLQFATGLSGFNDFIHQYWLYATPIRGMELARLNYPGSLSLPLQNGPTLRPVVMAYAGLERTSPKDAMCHSLKSSEDIKGRDNIVSWLRGPMITLKRSGALPEYLKSISTVLDGALSALDGLMDQIHKVIPARLGFVSCGYGLKVPLFDFIKEIYGKNSNWLTKGATALMNLDDVSAALEGPKPSSCKLKRCKKKWGITVERSPHCSAEWHAWKLGAGTDVLKEVSSARAEDFMLALTLRELKSKEGKLANTKRFTCQERNAEGAVHGPVYDRHLPVPRAEGGTECLPIAKLEWYCPIADLLRIGKVGRAAMKETKCGHVPGLHNRKLKSQCGPYKRFEKAGDHLPIVDWGRQMDSYARRSDGGQQERDRKETIGFLFPHDAQAFLESLEFASVVASPVRTQQEVSPGDCPPGFEQTVGDRQGCSETPLVGMTSLKDRAVVKGDAMRANLSSGGLSDLMRRQGQSTSVQLAANAGDLAGTWSRTQWAISQARVSYIPSGKDPAPDDRMSLFWPSWEASLADPYMLRGVLSLVTSQDDDGQAIRQANPQSSAIEGGSE